ncbi:NADPH-dependent FMN reductase [Camelimonas lactis]|uniref:FMN reductase n=1 Tax=Camelimonas lactis TaxID=659006 RepID=A0A4R2GVD6_9HYPH|nr:NAD(P)H-dependent oxidoreductase [Camelimonas lactis]TCO13103.1 FMN reductase [Camelimonas lactis]
MNMTHPPDWKRPLILGVGGATRPGSSTERALRIALDSAAEAGAETIALVGEDLDFPMYAPHDPGRSPKAARFVSLVARCQGLVIASPGYHGIVSGLVKNALDYVEDLRDSPQPYLENRAVGCIACAAGWQATGSTLVSLRSVVHALRGWPTPLGGAVNTAQPDSGLDAGARAQLQTIGRQVVRFARATGALAALTPEAGQVDEARAG